MHVCNNIIRVPLKPADINHSMKGTKIVMRDKFNCVLCSIFAINFTRATKFTIYFISQIILHTKLLRPFYLNKKNDVISKKKICGEKITV